MVVSRWIVAVLPTVMCSAYKTFGDKHMERYSMNRQEKEEKQLYMLVYETTHLLTHTLVTILSSQVVSLPFTGGCKLLCSNERLDRSR